MDKTYKEGMEMDKKQEAIESKIDENAKLKGMGEDLNALLAIMARIAVSDWKENKFINEFSESLGFKKHLDTACRIYNYLYPRNHSFDNIYDKIYKDKVKKSAWLKYNGITI
jgi:hypothetical protein